MKKYLIIFFLLGYLFSWGSLDSKNDNYSILKVHEDGGVILDNLILTSVTNPKDIKLFNKASI